MTTQLVSNSTGTVETSTSVAPDATLALPNTSVSYTHLDVYKRQVCSHEVHIQQGGAAVEIKLSAGDFV